MKLTPAQKKKFCEMHPKNQVIKKEKLAKCYNTILMNPHQVCQSSAINFNRFAGVIEKIYDENRDSIMRISSVNALAPLYFSILLMD